MIDVRIAGAGPAGSSAAIAAAIAGAHAIVFDPSRFPRHKVCGEFLSPEILPSLDALGVLSRIDGHRISRLRLRFPSYEKTAALPEAALGFSRYALDQMLLERACELGASVIRERTQDAQIVATGRVPAPSARGRRIFGFKAHYTGPVDDAIELYFFDDAYVGINCVEGGRTNVCGLAREETLKRFDFDFDRFVASFAPLRERLAPLERAMDWLSVGPLVFANAFKQPVTEGVYPAGDGLSFVDPFTGTGLAAAVITGRLAGEAAASGVPARVHLERCRAVLQQPFAAASIFRTVLNTRVAEAAAALAPASWLVRWTRPRIVA